jgi:uncharacterized membrane protein/thiol-disulfide isomerase/thioredoxin
VKRQLFDCLAAIVTCLVLLCSATPITVIAQTPDAVVHAVLFYSPNCPHCYNVIQNYLPPLFQKYGDQLEIVGIDVTQPNGVTLYQNAIERFQIPAERLGVPTLIVGDNILVGSQEIPELFPGLIDQFLAEGGVDWPDIPGLREVLATPTPGITAAATSVATEGPPAATSGTLPPATVPQTLPTPTPIPGLTLSNGHDASWQDKYALDPVGNTLSVVVLVGMLAALFWAAWYLLRTNPGAARKQVGWFIPVLCLAGCVVAGYLAYVETTSTAAVCGPVGDCNTVQQSQYAQLFGTVPIGVLGLVGYILILLAWYVARYGRGSEVHFAALSLLGMTMAGTLFSVYLTFLEPFVIGATCAWCLTSSVLMSVLMVLSIAPGKHAVRKVLRRRVK